MNKSMTDKSEFTYIITTYIVMKWEMKDDGEIIEKNQTN